MKSIPANVTAVVTIQIVEDRQDGPEVMEVTLARAQTKIMHDRETTSVKLGISVQSAAYNAYERAINSVNIDKADGGSS